MIYLDNNATTRVAPEVLDAMNPYLSELYGNPSSAHSLGRKMKQGIEQARDQVAALIGAADPAEIVFTSCGSESDNWAIRGVLRQHEVAPVRADYCQAALVAPGIDGEDEAANRRHPRAAALRRSRC